ncbi:MAG: dipeptide epimerase [Chloroflexaceae bacterium]
MITPTTVVALSAEALDIPLRTPFGIATGTQDVAHNILVTVKLADGTRGYGEAAPFAVVNGETQESAMLALLAIRSGIEGADVREWRRIAAWLEEHIAKAASARCAVETALLDALTRQAGMPLWAFFGGASTQLETDMTITTGTVDQATSAAQDILARGIRMIKLKVGSGDTALDLARITAVHAVAPAAPLILDGNGGFTADSALHLLALLQSQGIRPVLFEQPVPQQDWDGLYQVTHWGGIPVAADESVQNVTDALRVAQTQAAQVVNIKLMKCGIVAALDIAALCRSMQIGLMIGGMVESILAMTTSACFAAGQGGFTYIDLDTPLFLAENPFVGGFAQSGATLDLAQISAGHGVTPRVLDFQV